MIIERRKILSMLAEGKINLEEAEGLLDALAAAPEPPSPPPKPTYITQYPPLQKTMEQALKVAASDLPVLIVGETGTGKELVARTIHQASPRSDGPWSVFNCEVFANSWGTFESELFGHEKGAFTGAVQQRKGLLERTDGGTLFVDAVDAITRTEHQAKLFQFIHSGKFQRVGGTEKLAVDVRVIAATDRDLKAMVAQGRFYRHLFERLSSVTLELPPLRDRKDDIPLLVDHFLRHEAVRHNRSVPTITPEAMEMLMAYGWPSNVRELAGAIERAVVLCDDGKIEVEHLPEAILEAVRRTSGSD